jgi:photosystem II CP47 chlorophyll apoprotein
MWTSDVFSIYGSVRYIKPIYSLQSLTIYAFGAISAHHILAGFFGFFIAFFHVSSRPGSSIFIICNMYNIESVLATSIISVLWVTLIVSSSVWYGSSTSPSELFGISRYTWDNGYFNIEIERRVSKKSTYSYSFAWATIPDKICIYDYLGSNPSKGGLFRTGGLLSGDGLVKNWIGHVFFELGSISL